MRDAGKGGQWWVTVFWANGPGGGLVHPEKDGAQPSNRTIKRRPVVWTRMTDCKRQSELLRGNPPATFLKFKSDSDVCEFRQLFGLLPDAVFLTLLFFWQEEGYYEQSQSG